MKRKVLSGLLVVVMLFSVLCCDYGGNKVQAANKYWIYGSGYADEYGGKMKLYLKSDCIVIKGTVLKAKKQFASKGTKIKYSKKTLKLAPNCKIVECEGMVDYKYSYAAYCKERGIKASKNSVGVSTRILIKSGKVAEIYFSA